ncbi:MAG: hypothetical protein U1E34_00720 [Amaricoccus sp.]
MRDLSRNIKAVQALAPAVQSATVNGAAVDTKGPNRVAFIVSTGAITSAGDFSVKLQESADGSTFADVAAAEWDSDAPATLLANAEYRLGYRGYRRYVRAVLTKAGGTSIAAGAVAVLTDLTIRP